MQLLAARGLDPELKTVVIEDSHLRAELYAKLSVKAMTREEFDAAATAAYPNLHPQDIFMFENVFPLLRKLNRQRPNDPVLAVPVDGITAPMAMETAWGISTPDARHHSSRVAVDPKSVANVYGGSILRERETANHFRRLVTDRFPGRKSIVVYQGAHIFKNLQAVGADTDASGKVIKRAYLGWMSIVRAQSPTSMASYKVIAVDNRSAQWAPQGVFNLPPGIERSDSRAIGLNWTGATPTGTSIFTSGSFMATYRNSSITPVKPGAPIFDGAIIEAN